MGKATKERHMFLEFLQHELGVPRIIAGQRAYDDAKDPNSVSNYCKVYSSQYLWLCVVYDVHRRYTGARAPRYSYWSKLCAALVSLDAISWFRIMDSLDGALLQYVSQRSNSVKTHPWKQVMKESQERGTRFTHLLCSLLTPELHDLMASNAVLSFSALHQICAFPKRLGLNLPLLKEKAYADWAAIEDLNAEFLPRDIGREASILSEWFPTVEKRRILQDSFVPHHGPGAVLEGCKTKGEKFLCLHLTEPQFAFLSRYNLWRNISTAYEFPFISAIPTSMGFDDLCETLWVPKSWKTFRTISKETVTNMWLQQGIGACIDAELRSGRSGLSYWYALDTEGTNRYLAWDGSIDGEFSTIDLSAASDRITWEQFRILFSDTWLFEPACICRSAYTRVPGKGVRLQRKFAPMGSRLCFPVESAIFAAIVEGVVRKEKHISTYRLQDTYPIGAVYGDDIVIRTDLFDPVCDRLEQFGFVVNCDKTFGSRDSRIIFRESCGGEYANGIDVTPVRLSRFFPGLTADPEVCVPNLVELANALLDKQLPTARLAVLDHLLKNLNFPILFTEDGLGTIRGKDPDNHHLPVRYREDYQAHYYECASVVPVWERISFSPCGTSYHRFWDGQEGLTLDPWIGAAQLYEWLRIHPGSDRNGDRCVPLVWPDQLDRSPEYGAFPTDKRVEFRLVPAEGG